MSEPCVIGEISHCWASHFIEEVVTKHGPYAPKAAKEWVYRCCKCGMYRVGINGDWTTGNPLEDETSRESR